MFLGLTPQEREDRSILNRVMGVGGLIDAYFISTGGLPSGYKGSFGTVISRPTRYRVNDDGTIDTLSGWSQRANNANRSDLESSAASFDNQAGGYPYTSYEDAQRAANKKLGESIKKLREEYDQKLSRDIQYTALADQIRALGGSQTGANQAAQPQSINQALAALGSDRNFGASDLATRLNFQVSDQDILNDYNNVKINRLNQLIQQGNAQIAGITDRLNTAKTLASQLPEGDPRRVSSDVVVRKLESDLASVQSGVLDATKQIENFKPLEPGSEEALKQIVAFREYIQLPEERSAQQLRQIDPDTYKTAVGLGKRYRQMAMEPLPATTTPQTEQLRQTIEQEALNQLRLGSTIGAEERRGYEQAVRAAQTARGNIFGLGPAVQEAATLGAAGEQRKLARYGAAQQFLGSGETTGAAQARDLALRDALTQQRLGAAAGFIAGGPSIGNLAQARTQQQQGAFQNFIQATQPLPGQFNQAPSTAQNFWQVAEQSIPVALTSEFNKLYGSQASYLADTYGAQTRAQAATYTSPTQAFGNIASGLGNLFSFSKAF